MNYGDYLTTSEMNRWLLDTDIPWDDIDPALALSQPELLDRVHRFPGSGIFGQGEYPRIHDATRGPFGIFENFGNPRGRLLTTHLLADFVGERFGEPVDQCGGIVGCKFLKEPDDFTGGARTEQGRTHIDANLGDDLHGQTGVGGRHRVDSCPPLVVVEGAEDFGDVDGVPLLQQIQKVSGRTNAQQPPD